MTTFYDHSPDNPPRSVQEVLARVNEHLDDARRMCIRYVMDGSPFGAVRAGSQATAYERAIELLSGLPLAAGKDEG